MKRTAIKYKYNNVSLIDDNELDNFINEKMIEMNYFSNKVYVNTDGKSALEFINNLIVSGGAENGTYPDVIFIDLNMPGIDGFQFIENFKKIADTELNKCKLVILTSSINNEDRVKAKDLDHNIVFVNKPLTKAVLDEL